MPRNIKNKKKIKKYSWQSKMPNVGHHNILTRIFYHILPAHPPSVDMLHMIHSQFDSFFSQRNEERIPLTLVPCDNFLRF